MSRATQLRVEFVGNKLMLSTPAKDKPTALTDAYKEEEKLLQQLAKIGGAITTPFFRHDSGPLKSVVIPLEDNRLQVIAEAVGQLNRVIRNIGIEE